MLRSEPLRAPVAADARVAAGTPSTARTTERHRLLLAGQLVGTLCILAAVPGSLSKLVCLIVWWALTFRRFDRAEWLLFAGASLLFTGMNAAALHNGIFRFTSRDVLGMPAYELLMWGFYLVHIRRVFGASAPPRCERLTLPLTAAFGALFALVHDQALLWWLTLGWLVLAVALFHRRRDLAFVGYAVLMGAAVEYVGVWGGEWSYPGGPVGGVPPWFATMFGGIGLLLHRLVMPWLALVRPSRTAAALTATS